MEIAISLPEENPLFRETVETCLKKELPGTELKITVDSMNQPVEVLSGAKEWVWEAEAALGLVRETLNKITRPEK